MKLAPGAGRRAAIPAVAAALAGLIHLGVGAALALLAIGVLAFYRDPDRRPEGPGAVAPADGRVTVIREEDDRLRVGVFMNVWNVHVNRAPLRGTVESLDHRPGGNRPAFTKESEHNERLWIAFEEFDVVLIAGWFARRITPYLEPGERVRRGDRLGHIAFGSRADVVLPADFDRDDLRVESGDRVRAGETVLARRS